MSAGRSVSWLFSPALLWCALAPALHAQASPPDFSGVYHAVRRPGGGGGAPNGDGAQGRSALAPSLTPEYMAKWERIRKSRVSGSSEYDNSAKCLPHGMPSMMLTSYPTEILQTKDKITIFNENNDSMRRIYLDGRKPTQKHLDDPTYAGYSTGHWEGDTLVVDTVSLHPDSLIESIAVVFTPHSDQMTIRERIRFTGPGLLEDRMTVTDPKAFTKPWEFTQTYRRAEPGKGMDELREFACAEGIKEAH